MKSCLALVGFMGSGKTTVGRILSSALGKRLVSTDALIERRQGRSINRIFELEGEAGFRACEKQAVSELAGLKDAVIDCGGGLAVDPANVECLRRVARVVHLKVSPEVAAGRLSHSDSRPLLRSGDRLATISELMERRRPLYETAADFTIDTDGLAPAEVANRIIGWWRTHEG